MKICTAATLVLAATLSWPPSTLVAQEFINSEPKPSRAEWAPLGQAHGREYSTSDVTKVVVIGGGTPVADMRHGGISVAVVVNGQPYVIDCGPGFWRNSQASTPAFGGKITGLEPQHLTRLFLIPASRRSPSMSGFNTTRSCSLIIVAPGWGKP